MKPIEIFTQTQQINLTGNPDNRLEVDVVYGPDFD